MKTGNQLVKVIWDFYENKKPNIFDQFIDSNHYIVDESRAVFIDYRYKGSSNFKEKYTMRLFWDEYDGYLPNKREIGQLYKWDWNSTDVPLDVDELEFFDKLGFAINEEASQSTGQDIEDWYNYK